MSTRTLFAAGIATVALLIALTVAAFAAVPPGGNGDGASPFRLADCPAEDTCEIAINRHGWHIRECRGACDDHGARRAPLRDIYVSGDR